MSRVTELWVNRENYRGTRITESPARSLADKEVRVRIETFGLTSNNVSYAVSGDTIGYWKYYPADDPWGKVPVWGKVSSQMSVETITGAQAAADIWEAMLDNQVSPKRGIIASISGEG